MVLESVDPWHRYTSLGHDCIIVIEFAEDEGPKPVVYVPECPAKGTHFDGNAFAVWLMTTDYQNSGYRGSFSLSSDIQMLLENEEHGVVAYVHYFTLYDIDARGFVRPFCAAYVTPDPTKTLRLFSTLKAEFTEQIDLLKYCNKRQFGKELTQALDALNTLESQAISAYYELCYDSDDNVCSGLGGTTGAVGSAGNPAGGGVGAKGTTAQSATKPETLNMRYRRLQTAIQVAHKCVTSDLETNHSPNFCSHHVNMDPWITSLRTGQNMDQLTKRLKPFTALAPCAFDGFMRSMRQVLDKFQDWDASVAVFFPELEHGQRRNAGYVKLGSLPCLLPPPSVDKGHLLQNHEPCCSAFLPLAVSDGTFNGMFNRRFLAAYRRLRRTEGAAADRRLLSLAGKLKHVLYPLLTGQFTIVYGCATRKAEVMDVVDTLKTFIPCPCGDDDRSKAQSWLEGRLPPTVFADFKLVGMLVPKMAELRDYLSDNIVPFVARLNLNSDQLFAPEYQGQVLTKLDTVAHFHDSDRTFIPTVVSIVSELLLLAYVLRTLLTDESRLAITDDNQRLTRAMNILKLTRSDFKIVRYVAEMLQQATDSGDHGRHANTLEMMVLDYESFRLLKL